MDNVFPVWEKLETRFRPRVRWWLPAAAMDENDVRAELRDLKARGFGGVEIVVLMTLPPEIARSEDGWGTPNWDHMVDVIADETEALGMAMDIAIGPGWPIASPVIRDADDPAVLCELTFGESGIAGGARYEGALPERRVRHEEGTSVLVAAMAYLETSEKTLCRESYVDLTPLLRPDGTLVWDAPEAEGTWKVFAFYRQPAVQKINADQTYVIDHLSREGAAAVERYWDGVFASRKPYPSMESFFCDSLEYKVALDWTPRFPEEFEAKRGYSVLPYLPVIGIAPTYPDPDLPGYRFEDAAVSEGIRQDYLETLTRCYTENHLAALERIAEKYGKTVRYQVAYNKPFEAERSALYVAVPENEALGRPSIDYQKTMAAAAHLDRKDRYSFECAAEFGHSYGQSYEDLFWWIKRALMAGMNAQVLHGASYSGRYTGKESVGGQIPGVEWPGYEGFGKFVSNYWNRTLSVPDARGCLDAVTRLNAVFRGQALTDCLIFRDSYINPGYAGDFGLYDDGGALANRGYSYEFVSEALLEHPACTVENGELDAGGMGCRCLIIPGLPWASAGFLRRASALADAGLPIVWIGERPARPKFFSESATEAQREAWRSLLERAWTHENALHTAAREGVPELLASAGIMPRVCLDGDADVMTAVRRGDGATYCALYGYNRVEFTPDSPDPDAFAVSALYKKETTKPGYTRPGEPSRRAIRVRVEGTGTVWRLDPFSGHARRLDFRPEDGRMTGEVSIEEDEMILLALVPGAATGEGKAEKPERRYPIRFRSLTLSAFGPDEPGEVSFLRSGFAEETHTIDLEARELKPWRLLDEDLKPFAGKGVYAAEVTVPEPAPGARYVLHLGDVSDTFRVRVNGMEADFPDQVMKRVEITDLLRPGTNTLEIEVTSNLYNRLFYGGVRGFGGAAMPYVPRDYGIWETEGKRICLAEE